MFTQVHQIPEKANKEKIQQKANELHKLSIFREKRVPTLVYLGGCTNHALMGTCNNTKLIFRIPGEQSELLIDRKAEKHNQALVSSLGICPAVVETHAKCELQGYKVENCLSGFALDFNTYADYEAHFLPVLKKVHDCKEEFWTEFNIFERIILIGETLLANNIDTIFFNDKKNFMLIKDIIQYVSSLQEKFLTVFGQPELVPSHNDLSPANIFIVQSETSAFDIQIIDWETSGMNDRMFDLASIASYFNYDSRDEIAFLLKKYYQQNEISEEEIDKVIFYKPLNDLYVAMWSLIEFHMGNESKEKDALLNGWGPSYLPKFLSSIKSEDFERIINRAAGEANRM